LEIYQGFWMFLSAIYKIKFSLSTSWRHIGGVEVYLHPFLIRH